MTTTDLKKVENIAEKSSKITLPQDMSWFSIDFFHRVVRNSDELLKEAHILYRAGAYRRAGFLALTSYEEVLKITMLFKGTKPSEIERHGAKFKDWKDLTTTVASEVFRQLGTPQLVEQLASQGLDSRQQAAWIEAINKLFIPHFAKAFDPSNIRKALLFEDLNHQMAEIFLGTEECRKLVADWMIKLATGHLTPLLEFINRIPEEKLKKALKAKKEILKIEIPSVTATELKQDKTKKRSKSDRYQR